MTTLSREAHDSDGLLGARRTTAIACVLAAIVLVVLDSAIATCGQLVDECERPGSEQREDEPHDSREKRPEPVWNSACLGTRVMVVGERRVACLLVQDG
jgi:hypothetical protein